MTMNSVQTADSNQIVSSLRRSLLLIIVHNTIFCFILLIRLAHFALTAEDSALCTECCLLKIAHFAHMFTPLRYCSPAQLLS